MPFGRIPPIRADNEIILAGHKTELRMNWDPLFSLAPGLTDAQLKRAGLSSRLPGRPRAIRLSQDAADKLLGELRTPPPSEPGQTSITEPTQEELDDLAAILGAAVDLGPGIRVLRRTPVNFHFTGDIAGGSAVSELRVFGPVPNPFDIRTIEVNPISNVEPGQFLDVIISNDDNTTDTVTPNGISIFPQLAGFGNLPAADQQRGAKILATHFDIPISFRVTNANMSIKIRSFFVAPAIQLANLSVTLIIEELTGISQDTSSPFPEDPVAAAPPPAAPPAGPVQDTSFNLQVGSPMNGFGFYTSREDALAAAAAAAKQSPGLIVRAWGAQSGSNIFDEGTRQF